MRKHINKAIVSAVLITSIIISGASNLFQPVSAKTDSGMADSGIEISTEAVTDSDGGVDIQIEMPGADDDIVIDSDTVSDDGIDISESDNDASVADEPVVDGARDNNATDDKTVDAITEDDSDASDDDGITFLGRIMSMFTNKLSAISSDVTNNNEDEQDSVNTVHVRVPEAGGYVTVYMPNPITRTKNEWSVTKDGEADIEVNDVTDTVNAAPQTYEMKAFPNCRLEDALVFDNADNSAIHVQVNADEGYHISSFEVLSSDMSELENVDANNAKTFEYDITMPDDDVIIKAVFEKDADAGDDIEPVHGYDYKYTTEEKIAYGKYLGVSQWQDADNDYYLMDSFLGGRSGYELEEMGVVPLIIPYDFQNRTTVQSLSNVKSNSTQVSSLLTNSTMQVFTVTRKLYLAAAGSTASSVTRYDKVKYGNTTVGYFEVGTTSGNLRAYCCEHTVTTPAAGSSINNVSEVSNDNIRKVLYYGYYGPKEWGGFNDSSSVSGKDDSRWIVVQSITLSYYYLGIDSTGYSAWDSSGSQTLGMKQFIDYLNTQPSPPSNFKAYMAQTNNNTTQKLVYWDLESTPTPQPEKGRFSVNKSWIDNNNQYGIRPTSVTVTLYKDNVAQTPVTLNASNNWSYDWGELVTKEANGTTHDYRIVETDVAGYTKSYSQSHSGGDGGFKQNGKNWSCTIKNTVKQPETGNFTVTKVWKPSNNSYKVQPASVSVTLYYKTKTETSWHIHQTVTLNASNNWKYTWNGLVTKDSLGTEYTYRIVENNVPGYTIAYDLNYPKYSGGGFIKGSDGKTWSSTITNTIKIENGDITVKKVWTDYNDKFKIRPTSIYVSVYRKTQAATSWTQVASQTLNASNNWSYTWKNVPIKYGNNVLFNYKVVESSVSGYRVEYKVSNDGAGGFRQVPTTDGSLKYKAEIENIIETGFLKVLKESALPDVTEDNNCYSLDGAVYGVYSDNNCTTKVGEVTTDITGESDVIELLPGKYYVKEISASMGYELDTKIYEAVVTENHTKTIPLEVTVPEQPGNDPSIIEITKRWSGDKTPTIPTLEGTQFTICYYDGYYDTADKVAALTPKRKWVIEAKYNAITDKYLTILDNSHLVSGSDALYTNSLGFPVIPYGTITIQETKPAAGYTLKGEFKDKNGNTISPDEIFISQIKKENGVVALQGGNEYSSSDDPIIINITLKKYDTDGRTPLKDVTFELKNSKGIVVDTQTSNADGIVEFKDLYPDIYTATEIKTTPGHQLLEDAITIYAPMRVTNAEINANNIDRSKCIYDPVEDIYYIHNLTYEITNTPNFVMPMAGGTFDNKLLIPLGAGMVLLGCAFALVFRKRKRA